MFSFSIDSRPHHATTTFSWPCGSGSFLSGDDGDLLSQAEFVFFRDSVSLELAQKHGVKAPVMEFGPDGAFACDLRDEPGATEFLAANGLEDGKFLCCLSRLRYTPYWTIPASTRKPDPQRIARNEAMKERDHAPIREAIVRVVRETDLKVLLCPEDMTQMAVGNGIPAIVCRCKEQTSKGIMWRDIGLGDWLFDLDVAAEAARVPDAVLAMARDFQAAKAKTQTAQQFVRRRQRETMNVVAKAVEVA